MVPFPTFMGAPVPAPVSAGPVLPAENTETILPPKPIPVEESVGFFGTMMRWVQSNPIWTAVILFGILLAVLLLVFFIRRVLKNKGKKTQQNTQYAPVLIGNAHHIGARSSQQDSFAISDISSMRLCKHKGVFAVLADGMGGLSNGAEVSGIATASMLNSFQNNPAEPSMEVQLLSMVGEANDQINRFLGPDGIANSGTTVVAVIIKNRHLHWIAVGDSRICLLRNGSLLQLNREHNYGSDLDEKAAMGEITPEEACTHPQRAALTSYLGMGKVEKIDRNSRPMHLLPKDRVILMSDGVFGTLTDDEILSVMTPSPCESAAKLEMLVLEKKNPRQDNFTAIILECI